MSTSPPREKIPDDQDVTTTTTPTTPTITTPTITTPTTTTSAEAPLTMAASVVLAQLPRDASLALERAGKVGVGKVTIRLQPIGSAPHLTQRVFKLSSTQRFDTIVRFLRKRLGLAQHQSVFCYVGNVFAPGLDEGVGNLWMCFRQGEELVVGYAMAPAFG